MSSTIPHTASSRPRRPALLPAILALSLTLALSSALARGDTHAGLAPLRDSLRTWEGYRPAPDTLAPERTLQELFPGAEITAVGEAWRIALPPLHADRFAASLWAHGPGPHWTFTVDMERRDSLLALDGRVVDGLPADTALAWLHEHAQATLAALRALAVPAGPPAPAAAVGDAHVQVTLVGREIDRFEYDPVVWWRCARKLAQGMMVYAFLLEAAVGPAGTDLRWAVVLRPTHGQVQHLLEWRQHLASSRPVQVVVEEVRLVPGIRLDNVEDLLAPASERPGGARWPLRLQRP